MPLESRAVAACAALALAVACAGRGCWDPGPPSPPAWRLVQEEDGSERRVVQRGPYRTYYNMAGRVERVEYDSNDDGQPDFVVRLEEDQPRLLEVDVDFDGKVDRWEHYDAAGRLAKVGYSRGDGRPDRWTHLDQDGLPLLVEHDSDGDRSVDRREIFRNGRLLRVEVDSDRDGKMDRWQDWSSGILAVEDVDTDADGRSDRRLRYDPGGNVAGLERLPGG